MAYLQFNMKSEAIHQCIDFDVFLPVFSGVPETEPPFKTLYFLTGYGGGAKETFMFLNVQLRALMESLY